MAQPIVQKTIPTLYNMSSSQALIVLVALEEASQAHSIKYNLVNLPRRDRQTAKTLKKLYPINKSPLVTLESVGDEPPQIYQAQPNILTESKLILQFISDEYMQGEWVPETEAENRRDLFFQELRTSLIVKANFAVFLELALFLPFGFRHFVLLLLSPLLNYFKADLRSIFEIMENALCDEMPWFAGRKVGLSDFNLSFGMDMAVYRGYCEGEKWPKLKGWHERFIGRESYRRALAVGGKYDVVRWA